MCEGPNHYFHSLSNIVVWRGGNTPGYKFSEYSWHYYYQFRSLRLSYYSILEDLYVKLPKSLLSNVSTRNKRAKFAARGNFFQISAVVFAKVRMSILASSACLLISTHKNGHTDFFHTTSDVPLVESLYGRSPYVHSCEC